MVNGHPPPLHQVHNLLEGAICQGHFAVQLHPQGQILNLGPTHPHPITVGLHATIFNDKILASYFCKVSQTHLSTSAAFHFINLSHGN